MSILKDILDWTKTLPAWQSDAVSRLFTKQTLSQQDLDDLYALLKIEHGMPDPMGRVASKLDAGQVPAAPVGNAHVELLAMKNLLHVNAIAANQRLPFGAKGLTIVYGDNGSGKSGYSRVLKRACRARDQSEPIYPNAHLSADQVGIAEAVFEISVNGAGKEVSWTDGVIAPEELSSTAIFDTRCARAYLDEENDFAYIPYGLDILEGLAHTCNDLSAMINDELEKNEPDMAVFTNLIDGDTAVGRLIDALSDKTKPADIEALATLCDKEIQRREELENSLKADNPMEKAKRLRLCSARITKLANSVSEKAVLVDASIVTKISGLSESYCNAKATADLAVQAFKEDVSLLQGTGGEAWKDLFEAARVFCTEAYPEKVFPKLGTEAKCLLCQQPLDEGAERLIRFEEFIQNEVEKTAKARKAAFENEYRAFVAQNKKMDFDDELFTEIEALDKELAISVRAFGKDLANRQEAIKKACDSHVWEGIDSEPVSPAPQLRLLAGKLNQEVEDLEKVADEKEREVLQSEFKELDARLRLSKVKSAVLAVVKKYTLKMKLNKCANSVKTNAITKKATELAEKVISKELADSLNAEFKALGVSNLSVVLKSRSAKGKPLHKLKLAQAKRPGDILSEGEQRAVALGSFLAEVNLGGGTGGVVFDDPVSSLDHKRRERVSARLVQEAGNRQVIILTHDVYFLCILMEEASRLGVPCATQSLTKRPSGFGVAENHLPFEGLNTKDRVGVLRNMQQSLSKLHKDGDDPAYREGVGDVYRQLRTAWERAVEEVLFRNVVLRFRKGISTQPLIGVVVEDADCSLIDQSMVKCSNYAHDQALLGGTVIPEPDELLADIDALEDWRKLVNKRGELTSKKRKANL